MREIANSETAARRREIRRVTLSHLYEDLKEIIHSDNDEIDTVYGFLCTERTSPTISDITNITLSTFNSSMDMKASNCAQILAGIVSARSGEPNQGSMPDIMVDGIAPLDKDVVLAVYRAKGLSTQDGEIADHSGVVVDVCFNHSSVADMLIGEVKSLNQWLIKLVRSNDEVNGLTFMDIDDSDWSYKKGWPKDALAQWSHRCRRAESMGLESLHLIYHALTCKEKEFAQFSVQQS